MKAREKIEPIHIILLILGIVLLSGFIGLAVYSLRTAKHSADLSYSLENIDALLDAGNYGEARKIMEGMHSYPDYLGGWMQLLKRCRTLGLRTGDYTLFCGMALRAQKAHPDSEDIAAAAATALMDTGRAEEAAAFLPKLAGTEYRSLAAEIHVRGRTLPAGEPLGELVYAVLPESRNYLDFIAAAELSGESGFFLNAALLLLEAGRQEEALEILSGPGMEYPYITALASYDAGKFAEVDTYWDLMGPEEKMLPRSLRLRADSLMRQRRYDESENFHEIFLRNFPDYSPVPYLAMNFLQNRKTPFSGMPALQRGLAFFPRDPLLMLEYAKTLIAENKTAEGREAAGKIVLDYSAGAEGADTHTLAAARALRLIAQREELPLGRLVAELWILHNQSPGAGAVSALLRWHLFSMNDYPGIRQLLGPRAEEDEYSLSYLAALDLAEGQPAAAREELLRQTERFPECPEGFYNLGLVYLKLGSCGEALEAFRRAAGVMAFSATYDLDTNTQLRIFDTLVLLGRFPDASSVMRSFLEKNPHHPEALQKLRKLEARGE
ncbi:MAG: tetratricopeptide repeat protein [Spirochaetales bacterium]|jgi:tetratricopeptide (TPR) repeat protein|nr:tetratricopeptide repeat protein [Spirochaetales bacterium]